MRGALAPRHRGGRIMKKQISLWPAEGTDCNRARTNAEIRALLKAWEDASTALDAALTERVINFGLYHGLSLQDMQFLAPRNENGSPASLAGVVIDAFVDPPTKKN